MPQKKETIKRAFNQERLQEFIESGDFEYGNAPKATTEDFWSWLFSKLFDHLGMVIDIPYLVETLSVIFVLGALYYAFRTWNIQLFRREGSTNDALKYTTTNNDIYKQDIEQLLQKAIEAKNYREATRLLYLKLLRQLSDKELIEWKLDKTNNQYCREIKNTELLQHFQSLSRLYEYVWYGDFELNETRFTEEQTNFNTAYQFISQLKNKL